MNMFFFKSKNCGETVLLNGKVFGLNCLPCFQVLKCFFFFYLLVKFSPAVLGFAAHCRSAG